MALQSVVATRHGNITLYHVLWEVCIRPRIQVARIVLKSYLTRADAQANREQYGEDRTFVAQGQDFVTYFSPNAQNNLGVTPYNAAQRFVRERHAAFEAATDELEP